MTLYHVVNDLPNFCDGESITIPNGLHRPAFWVLVAAIAQRQGIAEDKIKINGKPKTYSETIGFNKAVFGKDNCLTQRPNSGKSYSPIVRLDSLDTVNEAASTINACIDHLTEHKNTQGIKDLRHVVGELHDNVWSHGMSTGFSMAQKYLEGNGDYIEFAIADAGLGFLQETRRARVPNITNHQEAIAWCIQKGHTTKPSSDTWAQVLPADATSNPYPRDINTTDAPGTHHLGWGLAQLLKLVNDYNGELYVVSGDAALKVVNSASTYLHVAHPWQGVAISCRLSQSNIYAVHKDDSKDTAILNIAKRLGGEHEQ